MATPGPTTTKNVQRFAGNLLKVARVERGLTQRELASAAGVPQSTVARIESGATQPTVPMLFRILAAVDLEPRIRLEPYDDHDDVLDNLAHRFPERRAQLSYALDDLAARFTDVNQ